MTINWWRCTQPDTTISRKASNGGTEPMPKVYCSCRLNGWTLRDRGNLALR
jgi:hypothetical protein